MRLRYLKSDNRGVIALEYAVILPIFLALILAIIELSFITFATIILTNSTTLAARQAKIGGVSTDALVAMIRADIRENSSILINADRIKITSADPQTFGSLPDPERCTKPGSPTAKPPFGTCPKGWTYTDINGNGKYDFPDPLLQPGARGERVRLTAFYEWDVITPGLSYLLGGKGGHLLGNESNYVISATTYVQNERY